MSGHAVAVVLIGPGGEIPVVRDHNKPRPWYWKFPGGRGNGNSDPQDVAIKKVERELGLKLKRSHLRILFSEERKDHIFTLFTAEVRSLEGLKDFGTGGEVKVTRNSEISDALDFFPPHQRIYSEIHARV
jgi:ADP-ribose pyrophosphatase YjhB (NUDIX family)